jgi:hypothetical protein
MGLIWLFYRGFRRFWSCYATVDMLSAWLCSLPVMRHGSLAALFLVVLSVFLATRFAIACSPVLPLKTLAQNVAAADDVYLATLVKVSRSPLPHDPKMTHDAMEAATFRVLQAIKGKTPKGGTLRTQTDVTSGSCALSLIAPYEEVRDGKVGPPKASGTWLLVLSGNEPYWLDSLSGSSPEEAIPRSELAAILQSVGKARGAK